MLVDEIFLLAFFPADEGTEERGGVWSFVISLAMEGVFKRMEQKLGELLSC